MLASAAAIATTAKLLSPIISDIYKGAKSAGAKGFLAWDSSTFPKKLARRLRTLEEVRTIWTPDKDVSLLTFYYASRMEIDGLTATPHRLADVGPRQLVIEGIVGQGKSVLLRYLAIQEVLSNDARTLPIFLELRRLTKTLRLSDAILQHLSSLDIVVDEKSLDYLYSSGKVSLLLDGFDELEEDLVKETTAAIDLLASKHPELQILVTSRPNHEIQKSAYFRRAQIAALRTSDYSSFMQKLGLEATKVAVIKEAIRRSPSKISGLITTPLMLTLVVMVYESEKEIPESLPEFFERLFRVVFSRHDRLKASFNRRQKSGLSERKLQSLFEAFCFMVMQNGFGRSLSYDEFQNSFEQALEYSGDTVCDAENFRYDLTKVACLMLEEGLDTTTFLHKSLMEYYSAAFIKHSMEEVASLFYISAREDFSPWREVLSFLKEIDPYRFSRDFLVPELEEADSKLKRLVERRDDEDLSDFLKDTFPNLVVTFAQDEESMDWRLVSLGPFGRTKSWPLRDFDTPVARALSEQFPSGMPRQQLLDIVFKYKLGTSDQKHFDIPPKVLALEFGSKELWRAVGTLSAQIERGLYEARKIIGDQQKRKLIFARRPVAQ